MCKILLPMLSLLIVVSGCATESNVSESSKYPRMPDVYRDNGNNKANRNPIGMSIYDAAETEAEEDYFGVEVVPLEESQRILRERNQQKQQTDKE